MQIRKDIELDQTVTACYINDVLLMTYDVRNGQRQFATLTRRYRQSYVQHQSPTLGKLDRIKKPTQNTSKWRIVTMSLDFCETIATLYVNVIAKPALRQISRKRPRSTTRWKSARSKKDDRVCIYLAQSFLTVWRLVLCKNRERTVERRKSTAGGNKLEKDRKAKRGKERKRKQVRNRVDLLSICQDGARVHDEKTKWKLRSRSSAASITVSLIRLVGFSPTLFT